MSRAPKWSKPSRSAPGAVMAACALLVASPSQAERAKNNVLSIESERSGGATTLRIGGTGTPTFTVYKLDGPPRVVVDITGSRLDRQLVGGDGKASWDVNSWAVGRVTAHEQDGGAGRIVRVVVGLARPGSYKVRAEGSDVLVRVRSRRDPPEEARRQDERTSGADEDGAAARAEARRAKRQVAEARAEAERARRALRSAKTEADKAKRRAEQALEEADRRKREAGARERLAGRRLSEAKTMMTEARERLERAEAMKQRAARATSRAEARERAAAKAEAKADERRERAAEAEAKAEAYRRRAASAADDDRREAKALERRAEKAAKLAEKRRREAVRAAKAAESRRAEALAAAKEADSRRDEAESAVAEVQRQRRRAELQREEAVAARVEAEARRREAEASRAEAEARRRKAVAAAEAAEKRASELARAAEQAEERAARARALRQKEEAAYRAAVTARERAEDKASEARRLRAREQAASSAAEAAADKLAEVKQDKQATEKAKKRAAAELTDLERAAERARARREREERRLAGLAEERERADSELAEARRERKRADAERERAKAALADAKKARAEAQERRERAEKALTRAKKARRAADAAEDGGASGPRVRDVDYVDAPENARVVVALSAPSEPEVVNASGRRVVLDIPGAAIPKKLERTLDTSGFRGPVKSVSSYRHPEDSGRVRVVVGLTRPVRGELRRVGTNLHWEFPKRQRTVHARPSGGKSRSAKPPQRPKARGSSGGTKTRARNQPPQVVGGFGATGLTSSRVSPIRNCNYKRRTIDLDFKDADIHNLMRLLADVGGVNIVIPDSISASVTVRLQRVDWAKAMEVILASKDLWYRCEGSLIRVATRKKLDAEAQAEAERLKAMAQTEAPEPEVFTLNYADASSVQKQLKPLLSPKGRLEVDGRTNSLIINDISAHRRRIIDLLRRLDTQTPQIQIEARIVEARSTYTRQIGIQWGGNFIASDATGNDTGLVFPNSIGVAGGSDDGQTPVGGVSAVPPNFAVNLPAPVGTGSGGALGLSLGSVNGNFNINLRLSALEDEGTVRIVSAPKITVVNNIQAEISDGVSIPISVVSAQGVQTQFVQADLSLKVTPHVSQRDCSISMDIEVTKNQPDFVNTGARGDPTILRKEARTTVLVDDGETSVIGGVYTRNTGVNYSKVPFFGDLPVLGWLFKTRSENDDRTEVLIFITPQITNRASLRCE